MRKIFCNYLKKYYSLILLMLIVIILTSIRLNMLLSNESKVKKEYWRYVASTENTDSRAYAYGFYAVTEAHLIAALVNIKRLKEKRLGISRRKARVDFLILTNIKLPKGKEHLFKDVKLLTYPKLPSSTGYYHESMVKLIYFNMTDYHRIIYMDIDALLLKPLDELFDLPSSVSLASPVAYWENELCFTSALLVLRPNHTTWIEVFNKMDGMVERNKEDMDLINEMYDRRITTSFKLYPEVLLLPGYFVVLSSHFRQKAQSYYKETDPIFGNIDQLVDMAYIVHFSGQLKPWDLSRERVLSFDSVSKYFYDINLNFIDEYQAVRNLLRA